LPDIKKKKRKAGEVLYVGNFSQGNKHKAFEILINAWNYVNNKEPLAHLVLVGGGQSDTWERMAKRLGCRGSMSFVGTVDDPDLYYCHAAVFVLPSRYEGMSNALLEAQSWGIPCVASDIPANRAVVEHGVSGFLFQVDDYKAMAEYVIKLLSNEDLSVRIGQNARINVEEKFDINSIACVLLEHYKFILGEGVGR
jgi:glycosyltransferase involved in cell wall biosynthesis